MQLTWIAAIAAIAACLVLWLKFKPREGFDPVPMPSEYRFGDEDGSFRDGSFQDVRDTDENPPPAEQLQFTNPGSEADVIARRAVDRLTKEDLEVISVEFATKAESSGAAVYNITFMANSRAKYTLRKYSLTAIVRRDAKGRETLKVAKLQPFGEADDSAGPQAAGDFAPDMVSVVEPGMGAELDALYGADSKL